MPYRAGAWLPDSRSWADRPVHSKPMPGRQLGGDLLHGGHGLARALARGGRALDVERRQAVVALEARRAVDPVGGGEGRERRHRAGAGADVPAVQVFRTHAVGRVGLDIDLLDPAAVDEVVDVRTAPRGAERGVDVGRGQAHRPGLGLVDVDLQLRGVVLAVGAHAGQGRILGGHAQHLVARGDQGLVADAADVLQLEVEARRGAQFRHGRRHDGEDHGVADLHELAHGPAGDGRSLEVGGLALVEVLQADEGQAGVLAGAGEAEAGDGEDRLHGVLLVDQEVVAHGVEHGLGAFFRRAGRQLDDGEHRALVFLGQEGAGQADEQEAHHQDDHAIGQHPAAALAQQAADRP
jgi:hypothetical protein